MPTNSEAVRLNLEYYRKQAKSLLKGLRAADSNAWHRFSRHSTRSETRPAVPALHDAQFTVAREQGFPSWPRFKAFIEQSAMDFHGLVKEFIHAALSDSRRADELLATHPAVAGAGLYVALASGDATRVEKALQEDPSAANVKGGPQQWEPLLYVCFSRLANGRSDRAHDFAATARLLVSHGADPNAFYNPEEWPDNPLPCLYGATGLNNNPDLARVLLEAGAHADDCESLYHSTEHPDLACIELLLQHGAKPTNSVLRHMLDRENGEGLRLLLAAGPDLNATNERGETVLHWAVWRGRSPEIVAMLLDSGADVNARRKDGRAAYALAVQSGQKEVAALLESRGAATELSALDLFTGACAEADPQQLDRLLKDAPEIVAAPENERLLPDLATSHRTAAVRALLAAGMPPDARGESGGTALHWACWKGYADLVKLLIDSGASLTIEDEEFHAPPSGWFDHGLRNCPEGNGDYAEVARLLIAAGAQIVVCYASTGNAEVDAVLREHGLLEV